MLPDEDAVVLLERDGVYSWHLPVDARQRSRSRSLEPGPRTRRFEIDVSPPRVRRTSGARPTDVTADCSATSSRAPPRRWSSSSSHPPSSRRPSRRWRRTSSRGCATWPTPTCPRWKRFETLDELGLPTDRPVRVLLFVHGTFSSTIGGFGSLTSIEDGKGFLRTLISAYDAVIGFDHKTLSVDPKQNAEALLERLKTHQPGSDFVIDVITHSRGGLVTRSFVEQVLPSSGWPATVDNIVFVASTNGGTHLADPERWSDLVDLYTNLAAVSAKVLTFAGAGPVAAVVGGVVKGIGAFVKYLVSYAAEGDEVPGLAAMVPGGKFVTEINKMQQGQPGPGTNWFVVSSNFHVSLFDDHHNPPEFPKELAVKLAEGFVDQLFEGDNDLVVDVDAMSAIGLPGGGFVRDTFALGENDLVYHNNYFAQLSVMEAIAGWLPLGLGAGGGDEAAAFPPPAPVTRGIPEGTFAKEHGCRPDRGRADSIPTQQSPAGCSSTGCPPAADRRPRCRARSRTSSPMAVARRQPAEPVPAHLAAEMPGHVVEKLEFVVRVRLSRNAIVATEGAAHAEADVDVDPNRPLSVQVIGKKNVSITGTGADVFALPPGGGSSELTFTGQALAPGPCVVTIVVKQGAVPTATMTLKATAVPESDAANMPLGTTSEVEAHPGIDAPELEGLPCIDIYECDRGNGRVTYDYAVRLEPGKPVQYFSRCRSRTASRRSPRSSTTSPRSGAAPAPSRRERQRKLQDIGSKMFDELFPEDMQAHLWSKKAKVKDLILYADEPFVPWELVHLKPPTGPREEKPRFLAQGGLVRWQPGSFPPREMRVRAGQARSLVPSYKDPRFALTEPVHEEAFLAEKFGATKVTATPTGVRTLLRSGAFDLLHFSGHGAADPAGIETAKLLMQGLKRAGTVEPQYLGATTVSENATWASQGTPGPVVVLNACQAGQAGALLTTVGGFAKAFLDAGASAFVSCLWSVHEQPSRIFVEKLYDELLAGSHDERRHHEGPRRRSRGRRRHLARLRRLRPARRRARHLLNTHPEGPAMTRRALCVGHQRVQVTADEQLAERLCQRRQRPLQDAEEARLHRAHRSPCCATRRPPRRR